MLKPAVGGNKATEKIQSRFKTRPISTITAQNPWFSLSVEAAQTKRVRKQEKETPPHLRPDSICLYSGKGALAMNVKWRTRRRR